MKQNLKIFVQKIRDVGRLFKMHSEQLCKIRDIPGETRADDQPRHLVPKDGK